MLTLHHEPGRGSLPYLPLLGVVVITDLVWRHWRTTATALATVAGMAMAAAVTDARPVAGALRAVRRLVARGNNSGGRPGDAAGDRT